MGEIDIASRDEAERALTECEKTAPSTLVVDLRGLSFMDSSGVHALLDADSRARQEGRRFVLISGPPAVHRIFSAAGLEPVLEFAEDDSEFRD